MSAEKPKHAAPARAKARPDPAPIGAGSGRGGQPGGNKTLRALLRLLIKLAVAAGLCWALLSFVLGVYVVHSNDMYPAVRDGDLCITFRLKAPAKGDVVAYTDGDGVRHFGRVAAAAGDVIDLDADGHYTVNGGVPYETIYYATRPDPASGLRYPYTVPEGEVFLLNDLRDNPTDSRRFGAIPLTETDGSLALLLRRRGW